jgi:SAM-dependent methyltransferase
MQTVSCNLCCSEDYEISYLLRDLLLDRNDVKASLVRCKNCGLVYQNPRPTPTEMEFHYPPKYESYTSLTDSTPASWLLKRAYRYGFDKRGRAVTRYKEGGKLLDIGCATGNFLVNMRKREGWEVYGVDTSQHAVQMANEQHGLDVFCGTLEEANFPENFFHAITLWDVFEHLPDPSGSLVEIQRILKPDGILVLRVPNLHSWDARIFGSAWAGLDAPRHLYVFTPRTLSAMVTKQRFKIVRMSCEIGSYPTFVLSLRFWLLSRSIRKPIREKIARIMYHPLMRLASAPFFYIYGLGLKGPLLTMTAMKE